MSTKKVLNAAQHNQVDFLRSVEVDKLCNLRDGSGDSCLHRGARGNAMDVVKYLLDVVKMDPNVTNKQFKTSLHEAALIGSAEMIELLLDHDALIDCSKYNGWTPLMITCQKGFVEAFKMLIDRDEKLFLDNLEDRNKEGSTCLYLAARSGSLEIVKMLVESGADVNTENNNARRPVHACAMTGNVEILTYLVAHGASINVKDSSGTSLWHEAAGNGQSQFLQYLEDSVRSLANDDDDHLTIDNSQRHPLHKAAAEGHAETCTLILALLRKHDIDPNLKDIDGATPLHLACGKGHANVVEALLQDGRVDVNATTTIGDLTPLQVARNWKRTNCVDVLNRTCPRKTASQ